MAQTQDPHLHEDEIPETINNRRKEGDRRKETDRRKKTDRRMSIDRRKQTNVQEHKALILLVDDNPTNLRIGKNTLSKKYTVATAPSAAKMFSRLEKSAPAIILLDIDMPEMNGYEAIKHLKSKPETKDIPVIFLTARTEAADELQGLNLGAIDYIIKPYDPGVLLKRIEIRLATNMN